MQEETQVNLARGSFLAHCFHFFLGAAKCSLFPFLTLFFRMLGLSATQVGLVFGVKAFINFWAAPLGTRCAKGLNKKRSLLMLSLFIMLGANLMMTMVPPANPEIPLLFCGINASSDGADQELHKANGSDTDNTTSLPLNVTTLQVTGSTSLSALITTSLPSTSGSTMPPTTPSSSSSSSSVETTTTSTTTESPSSTTETTTTTTATTTTTTTSSSSTTTEGSEDNGLGFDLSTEELEILEALGLTEDMLKDMTADELEVLINKVAEEVDEESNQKKKGKNGKRGRNGRHRRDVPEEGKIVKRGTFETTVDTLTEKISQVGDILQSIEYRTFVLVMVMMCVGELLSASVEKLADDCWFEYLDILDSLERYGSHKLWAAFGCILVAPAITAIIDNTDCYLLPNLHHILLHFFVFAGLGGFAFVFAFSYPISQNKKTPKKTTLVKGMRVLFSDGHSFSLTFSIFLLGMIYGIIYNFLFWKVQDLGGTEIMMGSAVAIAAFSELVILLAHKPLVKRLTSVGAMVLGLLLLTGRLVFYSFLWSPWLVVAGEAFHGLSHTLMFCAVHMYPDFRINPFIMDRSANALLNAIYYGLGFAGGSILAGFAYDLVGFDLLFQGAAVIVLSWGVLFLFLMRCFKKKQKVRYARLLQDEDENASDTSLSYDEDWLEVALKRDR